MLRLFKYLKNHVLEIILIIGLLVVQANLDLSLPEYTSKIVDVGIQQQGIETGVYEYISETHYNNLLLFLDDDSILLNNYELLEKNEKNIEDYPLIEEENIYVIKEDVKKEEIEPILNQASLLVSVLQTPSDFNKEIFAQLSTNLNMEVNSDNIFMILSNMTKEEQTLVLSPMIEQFGAIDEAMITQMAIATVQVEYTNIGINLDDLQMKYILNSGLIMLGISLVIMAVALAVLFLGSRLASKLAYILRMKVFENTVNFSKKEIQEFGTASLITRTTNDIQQVQQVFTMLFRVVFYAPILAIGGMLKMTDADSSMLIIIVTAVVVLIISIMTLFIIVMPKFTKLQSLIDKLNLVSREILNGIPVIRAFSNESHEEKRFEKANKDLTKVNLFINRTMSAMMPIMMLIMNVVTVAILWYGSYAIDDGLIQVGDMMAYIQYAMQIIMAFLMISIISIILPRATIAAKRIREVINTKSSVTTIKNPKKMDKKIKEVEFKNVCFRYPNADEDVLTDISFIATLGTTTAFIGSTGSGKSTVINLLPRFFDTTEGNILFNGTSIKDFDLKELRDKIGYVPQKGMLFTGTVESNIKYGDDSISKKEMLEASKIAQAKDFVEKLEKKYDSEIAQGGTNVSGGQRQRLSIARAIAVNPDLFIFDDSFSALDFKTDAKLRKELTNITKDKIVFIVAQRVSTIMNADQIVVLDEGKTVGIGTHEELLKNCTVYKEIAESQLSKEELGHE